MKKYLFYLLALSAVIFQSCIGDDIEIPKETAPEFRLLNLVSEIETDGTHQLEFLYLNNFGMTVEANANWESSDESSVADISATGLLMGKNEGTAKITGTAKIELLIPNSQQKRDTSYWSLNSRLPSKKR